MFYRAIGLMSGSSLDGLDIAFAEFNEQAGKWSYEIKETACYEYDEEWTDRLKNAISLNALDYQLLHTDYGHYIGNQVNKFIEEKKLHYQVGLIASHGHTTFHVPAKKMTAQLGDGAAIAATTGLPVVSDLRAMDVALGGQGAPIVPIGEKLLLGDYDFFLNLGGIANISHNNPDNYTAFDICPANRVLNMLMNELRKEYDEGGQTAATGKINDEVLNQLNQLEYYKQPHPKSLANDFGTDIVYPLIKEANISIPDALRTFTEHIAYQIQQGVSGHGNLKSIPRQTRDQNPKLLATGGGAFNTFLINLLQEKLSPLGLELIIPDEKLIAYKEALIMAFIGVLRWRQDYNSLASVTGASRNSIGGALWTGQEA
jgi:anhydro-N-acetylmuramic acid kinase